MKFVFDPLDPHFKSPVGGVEKDHETDFRLVIDGSVYVDGAWLVLTKDGEQPVHYPMRYEGEEGADSAFVITLAVTSAGLYFYHFAVEAAGVEHIVRADADLNASVAGEDEWQLTAYETVYPAPDWLDGGVIYQILPDRFHIGGERLATKPDAVYRDDWGGLPVYEPDERGIVRNDDFFGGNLLGIIKKLIYLKSLGVTCIYLNPIFEAHSNHKYDTGNYRRVDSDFGTVETLKKLIDRAAKRGIRIVLDGVFSHTGDDSIYFNKCGRYDSVGAWQSQDSPYASWYTFERFPDLYKCWWDIKILPNVNETDPTFDEFINGEEGVVRTYTRLGLGGWRLDVADELPDAFLDHLTHAVKSVCPDALILGEVWEDASNKCAYGARRRYFAGGQLNSVTNYPFKEDIVRFVRTGDAARLDRTVRVLINNYPPDVMRHVVNLLGTHDTVRILSALGDSGDVSDRHKRAVATLQDRDEAVRRLLAASVLQYTLPGVPCVYYGDEAGMEGFEDPFNRRCYPWEGRDGTILRHYKRLGRMRTDYRDLFARGAYRTVRAADGVLHFLRTLDGLTLTVAVNAGTKDYILPGEYSDVLTKKRFAGRLRPGEAVVLVPAASATL